MRPDSKSLVLQSSGMSLLEVTIAMGVTSIALMGMMATMSLTSKLQSSTKNNTDFNTLVNYINLVVANDASCSVSLGISSAPVTVNLNGPTNIKIYNTNGTVFAATGQTYGSLTVSALQLNVQNPTTPITNAAGNRIYQAQVVLSADKATGAIGAKTLTFNNSFVNIEVNPANNALVSCTGIRLGSSSNAANLPTCDPGYVVVSNGTSLACKRVTCPATQHPATYDSAGYITSCLDGYIPVSCQADPKGVPTPITSCTLDQNSNTGYSQQTASPQICPTTIPNSYCPVPNCAQYSSTPVTSSCNGTCQTNYGGTVLVNPNGGAHFCKIHLGSCPKGLSQIESWTTTSAVYYTGCLGGSDTGCGEGVPCTTGSHSWSNVAPEQCKYSRWSACGPATNWACYGNATVTDVGCSMPN